jgi:hypothetical protein
MFISKGMVLAAAVIGFGIVSVNDLAKGSPEAQAATTDATVVESNALRRRAAGNLRALLEQQDYRLSGSSRIQP